MSMKNKGQRNNRGSIGTLALFFVGPVSGELLRRLEAQGRGSDSPRLHGYKFLPVSGSSRPRGTSSGMSQGRGWKPAVILAPRPEESKGQDDVPRLQDSMHTIWA